MSTKLFVGSLAWATTDDSLQQFFAQAGSVVSASVIRDKMSGRSKGFGFVEYATEEEAKNALDTLNGQELDGRAIVVSEARPREERPQGGGFGNRGGGGGYGRSGGNDRRSGGGGYGRSGGSRGGYNNDRRGGGYQDRNSGGSNYSSNQPAGDDYSAAPAAVDYSTDESEQA